MLKREVVIAPPGGPSHGKGMVQAIKAGGLIFFSAIRGNDPVANFESNDTKEQARADARFQIANFRFHNLESGDHEILSVCCRDFWKCRVRQIVLTRFAHCISDSGFARLSDGYGGAGRA